MKTISLIVFSIFFVSPLFAQVSGNIKMRNKQGQILADNSGIAVVFIKTTGQRDTVYTNYAGNYNISTLPNGYYGIQYWKGDYWPRKYPNSSSLIINNNSHTVPAMVMNEILPKVILNDTVSGVLQPYTYYLVDSSNLVILPGDTLVIPEGCILGLNRHISVQGCLMVQGTSTSPVYSIWPDSTFQGIVPKAGVNYFNVYVGSNASASFDHCYISHGFTGKGDIRISHSDDYYDTLNQGSFMCEFFLTGGSLEFSENKNFHADVWADNLASLTLSCNVWNGENISLHIDTLQRLNIENNHLNSWCLNADRVDTFIFHSNYLTRNACWEIDQANTNPLHIQDRYMKISNNYFAWGVSIDIGRFYDIDVYNNFGVTFYRPYTSTTHLRSFHHNVVFPYYSSITSGNYSYPNPQGTFNGYPIATNTLQTSEYIDSFHNTYMANQSFVSSTLIDYLHNPPFNPKSIGLSYLIDQGTPNIIDPDGSISDIGIPYQPSCLQQFFSLPAVQHTVQDSVFPGDTDNNGICNVFDIFNIALGMGELGPPRFDSGIDWRAHYSKEWFSSSLFSNRKHWDANGDGLVSYDDVDAIAQNYSSTHVILKQQPTGNDLVFKPNASYYKNGDTVTVELFLRDSTNYARNLRALMVSLQYDSALVSKGSFMASFENSCIGNDSIDFVSFAIEPLATSSYDLGMALWGVNRIDTFGRFATIQFVIDVDSSYMQAFQDTIVTTFAVNDASLLSGYSSVSQIPLATNGLEIPIVLDAIVDTSIIIDDTTSIGNMPKPTIAEMISVFPNPAKENVTIKLDLYVPIELSVYTINGNSLLNIHIKKEHTLDTSTWEPGIYVIRITHNGQHMFRRITKI